MKKRLIRLLTDWLELEAIEKKYQKTIDRLEALRKGIKEDRQLNDATERRMIGVINDYMALHKQFFAGADISPREGSRAVLCMRDRSGDRVKFYSLSNGNEARDFLEKSRHTNPHVDAPMGFMKY